MDQFTLNLIFIGASFALYFGIAIWARAGSTAEFYAANRGVHPVMNGMATAADWMSAASFISMAGLLAMGGYGASAYLMGWTGGYVLLAMLLAPYLRKFGKFTVPEFIGDRFYSKTARIIGVTEKKDVAFGNAESLNIWMPYTTVMGRLMGTSYFRSITVRVHDGVDSAAAEEGITALLTQRHGRKDFFAINTDSIKQTVEKTTQTMTLLISAIAVISLVVGGIGVMNIMLVSVAERTQEIGVRMAVGARQSDILKQFLIEAVLVCLVGGVLGIALALLIGFVFDMLAGGAFSMVISTTSIILAFACSTLIGVLFGFLPARRAAQLDPVDALSRQ
jgi:ABC-type antimicrobial peptide transport system permease subunit